MNKLILVFMMLGLLADTHPKDITGKWMVDAVWVGDKPIELPISESNRRMIEETEKYRNALLSFKADHQLIIDSKRVDIVKKAQWEYNAATGTVKIVTKQNGKPVITTFSAWNKDGKLVFALPNSPVNLRLHKQ